MLEWGDTRINPNLAKLPHLLDVQVAGDTPVGVGCYSPYFSITRSESNFGGVKGSSIQVVDASS